ncbi:MAG: ABC transporter permease subunit, partial [Pirellulaceae bacterium]
LLRKNIRDSWWLWFCCALTLFNLGWLHVWVVSRMNTESFQLILDNFQFMERMLPVSFAELITYSGRISQFYNEPVVLICVLLWCISRGSDIVSGQLNRGTMEMILAQPVSRMQVFWSHALVTLAGTILLPLVAWCGSSAGIANATITERAPHSTITIPLVDLELRNPFVPKQTITVPLSERVRAVEFLPAASILACLGICFAGITMLLSSLDRFRRRTVGIATGIVLLQMILRIAGLAHESLSGLLNFTIFAAYNPSRFVIYINRDPDVLTSLLLRDHEGVSQGLGPLPSHLLMILVGMGCMLAAALIFRRRDLPAPL